MRAVGIILAGAKRSSMGVLTNHRNNSAMPVGGAYRTIDFPLTNMSQSGVKKVAVISQHSTRSLADHISSSKWWNFGRKNSGIFLFTPDMGNADNFTFKGTADAIYQNIQFLQRSQEPYVVICPGEQIMRVDYSKVIKYHMEKGADITMMYTDLRDYNIQEYGVMTLDEDKRLLEFEEKPLEAQSSIISLGVYVIGRQLLIQLLEELHKEGRHNLVADIIVRYRKKLKIYGYEFNGYWKSIKDVNALYQANMDFLDTTTRKEIFQNGYVYTKSKDDPPVKYSLGCEVNNSILNGGDIINGVVTNSVLSRKVFIGEGAIVRNSIIMEGCTIGKGAVIENAILDKAVYVGDGQKIIGDPNDIKVLGKNAIV